MQKAVTEFGSICRFGPLQCYITNVGLVPKVIIACSVMYRQRMAEYVQTRYLTAQAVNVVGQKLLSAAERFGACNVEQYVPVRADSPECVLNV